MSATGGSRRGLRPDTFPFLAVLLCAMGSLILLLLVMDRRAKAVARAKVLAAASRVAEEDVEAAAARQEEWERRRAALRAALEQQEEELRGQLQHVTGQLQSAQEKLRAEHASKQTLEDRLRAERQALAEVEQQTTAEQERAARAKRHSDGLEAERAKLAADLEQVRRAIADLKLLRHRRQETYSVVPYRGKHGDSRRPVYVECAAAELIFHPDRKVLRASETELPAIRAEVERRVSLRPTKPYLLFLVRPNGIESYYKAQAALVGLNVEFGYELIDAEWALEFPEEEKTGPPPPVTVLRPNASPSPGATGQGTIVRRGGEALAEPLPSLKRERRADHPSLTLQAPTGSAGASPSQGGVARPEQGGEGRGEPRTPFARPQGVPPVASMSLGPPSLLGPALGSGNAGGEKSPSAGGEIVGGSPAATRTPVKAGGQRAPARDWVIAVECRADAFILYPGGTRIPASALGMLPDGDNALVKAVREEIARRQARPRADDAPDRPHLRFLVRPDGTRTYYRAFPLLEPLNVPMTRMNLEANEELGLEHLTR